MNDQATIADFLADQTDIEMALLTLSDAVWLESDLAALEQKLSPPVFMSFIAVQTVGCSLSDGWAVGVFSNSPQIVPYLEEMCVALGWQALLPALHHVLSCFPIHTDFMIDDQAYCDVINLLEKHEKYIQDKTYLNTLSLNERKQLQIQYQHAMDVLEDQANQVWGDNPWQMIYDYALQHQHVTVFKSDHV